MIVETDYDKASSVVDTVELDNEFQTLPYLSNKIQTSISEFTVTKEDVYC